MSVSASGGRARTVVRRGDVSWLPGGRLGVGSILDVYVMNADGSGRRRITRGEQPVWSPGGREVVVGRYYANRDTTKLFVVDVRTRAERAIPQPHCRCAVTDESPSWSPDGRRLVFTRFVDAEPAFQTFALQIVNADATHVRRLAKHEVEGVTWSPRGDRVAGFDWDDTGPVVRVISVDDGSVVTVGRGASPAWSPNGNLVAFRGRDGAYVVDADGAKLRRLAGPIGPTCPAELSPCRAPAWAPDGNRVLWASRTAIVVSSTDGRIGKTVAHGTDAAWSPDAGWIALAEPECGEAQGVYVVRLDSTEPRRLSRHCTIYGTPLRERIVGTPADDTIYARDGKRDKVDCGRGTDRVIADKADLVTGCEVVRRR
jgi:Tol biopolymer transport system component